MVKCTPFSGSTTVAHRGTDSSTNDGTNIGLGLSAYKTVSQMGSPDSTKREATGQREMPLQTDKAWSARPGQGTLLCWPLRQGRP